MRAFSFGITILVLLLNGCAAPLKDVVADHEKSAVCCESIAEFQYEAARVGDSLRFKIDPASPAFVFPEGKSFFKAYALPSAENDYLLALYSYPSGVFSGPMVDSHVLYPALMFLDKDFKVLRVISRDLMRYQPPTWGEGARLEGRMIVPGSAGARYLVIYTTKELLEQHSAFSFGASTGIFMSGNIPVPVTNPASSRRYPHAPVGDLKIELRLPPTK